MSKQMSEQLRRYAEISKYSKRQSPPLSHEEVNEHIQKFLDNGGEIKQGESFKASPSRRVVAW